MTSLVIGADNCAAQGFRWAKALRENSIHKAMSMGPSNNGWDFEIDKRVDLQILHQELVPAFNRPADFRYVSQLQEFLEKEFSYFLIEYFNPIVNWGYLGNAAVDKKHLAAIGKKVAFLAHGSDLIVPSKHMESERYSPHFDLDKTFNNELERKARNFQNAIFETSEVCFISTLNLLPYAPNAIWLPVVAKEEYFTLEISPTRKIPLVVHAPSDPVFKGTKYIEPILLELNRRGIIRYIRCERLNSLQLLSLIRRSDFVIDQISLGSYGVLGADAMAGGKLVFGHVSEDFRELYEEEVPIIEIYPDNLEEVIIKFVEDLELRQKYQYKSREFARKYHDGRLSSRILCESFLGD